MNANVRWYGALGDVRIVTDGAIDVGANATQLTSATAAFTSADVGKAISVVGAGAAGVPYASTIAAVINATTVTLTDAATTTVAGARVVFGTDDSAAFTAAVAALPNGGTIYVPAGTYLLENVALADNITLYGDGPVSHLILKALTTHPMFDLHGLSHVTIRDLQIDGNKSAQLVDDTWRMGLYGPDVRHLKVLSNYFTATAHASVYTRNNASDVLVDDNTFYDCGQDTEHEYPAIYLTAIDGYTKNLIVTHNHIENCRLGMALRSGGGSSGNAIAITGVVISGNTFLDNAISLQIAHMSSALISNNAVINTGGVRTPSVGFNQGTGPIDHIALVGNTAVLDGLANFFTLSSTTLSKVGNTGTNTQYDESGRVELDATLPWVMMNTPAAAYKPILFKVGGVTRWQWSINANTESGANAGSNLEITRYNDAGGFLGHTFTMNRATGDGTYQGAWNIKGATGALLTVTPVEVDVNMVGGAATVTAANAIPAGSFVYFVTARVQTTLAGTGLTTWRLGDGTTADLWATGQSTAAGTRVGSAQHKSTWAPKFYSAAQNIVFSAAAGVFDSGTVHLTIYCLSAVGPVQ